jgi:ribosomal protein S12 methylthiotransferase RimO
MTSQRRRVALLTLGCGRNEVDSDQVAGALNAAGFDVVDADEPSDAVIVNTCTFIAPARQESVEAILSVCEPDGPPVLVIGCMAERYGAELAEALPEVAGVLGFADYPRLPDVVATVVAGGTVQAAPAAPARRGLPLFAARPVPGAPPNVAFPIRTEPRGPWAYLKLASGCDRVCTFCSIPSFRGRFVSRPADEVLEETRWLVAQGVREVVCVSENTTSWGKDLPGGRHTQADLIRGFESIAGLERVRLMYLQPAELLPELLDAMAASPVVAPYYDLSLQHASASVLQRMARSGSAERFLSLIDGIRRRDPSAVFRSSFITGFPGETDADVEVLEQFLAEGRLDWVGVFCFSPEDGTPAAAMPDQVPAEEAARRRDALVEVAEAVAEANAEAFVGRTLDVLVESADADGVVGRSYREAPETDGEVRVAGAETPVGRTIAARVLTADGVDLVAEPVASPLGRRERTGSAQGPGRTSS